MKDNLGYLDAAKRIGDRLVNSAIYNEGVCTWLINTVDREDKNAIKTIQVPAEGEVYQGTAGIALFLMELYRHTGISSYKECSYAALSSSYSFYENGIKNYLGFYTGSLGIAYAFYHASKIFDDEELHAKGRTFVEAFAQGIGGKSGGDVIGGAAGAIPALLKMSEFSEDNMEAEIAIKLGRGLIESARKETIGWSWGSSHINSHARCLCGFAHGASGYGNAFMELYNYTKSADYLYSAEQAYLYERQFFNLEVLNWPDFRHSKLARVTYNAGAEEMKESIRKKGIEPYKDHYMYAWCHGAAGIALSRLRAFEVTGEEGYKKEADLALKGVQKSLDVEQNYSLCHGVSGNCEPFLYAGSLLSDNKSFDIAAEYLSKGIEKYETAGEKWPCGTNGGVSDPSLMLGEAGVGHFLLRMYSSEVDSVLLIRPKRNIEIAKSQDGIEEIRNCYVNEYFAKTIGFLNLNFPEFKIFDHYDFYDSIGQSISDVGYAFSRIEKFIGGLDDENSRYANDIFMFEKAVFEMMSEIKDFTEEIIYNALKQEVEDVDWKKGKFCLSKTARIVKLKYDWDSLFNEKKENILKRPEDKEQYYILYKFNNEIVVREIGLFPYFVFKILDKPVFFSTIIRMIAKNFEGSSVPINQLEELLTEQLINGYQVNCISIIMDN